MLRDELDPPAVVALAVLDLFGHSERNKSVVFRQHGDNFTVLPKCGQFKSSHRKTKSIKILRQIHGIMVY